MKSRKKAAVEAAPAEDTSFNPTEFENPATPIVQELAEHTRLPDATEREGAHENGHAARQHATGYVANPSSKRRESHAAAVRKLPGMLGIAAADLIVELIDAGDNRKGIGIRVKLPEGRTLSDDEKQIIRRHVKGEGDEQTGFSWDRDNQMWHKLIVRDGEHPDDVPRTRPVAIRLDAESRVAKLAEALQQHQADPVGYADRIRQEREQAADRGRIPD